MVSVALSAEQASARWIAPWGEGLSLAALNGPASRSSVSGGREALAELLGRLRGATASAPAAIAGRLRLALRARSRRCERRLLEDLAPIEPRSGEIPFYSTVTGEARSTGPSSTPPTGTATCASRSASSRPPEP